MRNRKRSWLSFVVSYAFGIVLLFAAATVWADDPYGAPAPNPCPDTYSGCFGAGIYPNCSAGVCKGTKDCVKWDTGNAKVCCCK